MYEKNMSDNVADTALNKVTPWKILFSKTYIQKSNKIKFEILF